jgi:hypothetical protein
MAAEAASGGRQLAAPTAWDLAPTHSTAVGMSIVARTRIGTVITSTPIGTALTGPTRRTVALAGGGLQRGACGCAATSARITAIGTAITSTHIGTAIVSMADTAIIVRTAAIMVRPTDVVSPTDVVPPTDTDASKLVAERDKCGPKQLSGTRCRRASFGSRTPLTGPSTLRMKSEGRGRQAGAAMSESFGFGVAHANDLIAHMVQRRTFSRV